jgi:antirestriction protein ArdC
MMIALPAAADDHAEHRVERATFILRLQREPHGQEQAAWRGTVEHVQSGERRAVPDAAAAAALVISWLHRLEEASNALPG